MNCLITRFPYRTAYGGEEYHTLDLALFMRDAGHTAYFFGSCPVLHDLFRTHGFKTWYSPSVPMPVTPLTLVLFLFVTPFFAPIIWCYVLYIACRTRIRSLYAVSLIDKLYITPLALLLGWNVVWVEHQRIGNWLTKSPLQLWYKYLSRFVRIIPVSPVNETVLTSVLHVPEHSIFAITHGVTMPSQAELLPVSQYTVGYSGRLEAVKGVDVLIRAVHLAKQDVPELQLEIYGSGSALPDLQQLIHSLNASSFIRIAPPLPRTTYEQFLKTVHVFVLPSITTHETFGLVAAEAMVHGAQLIVTSVCGIAHTLQQSPATIVSPGSVPELCEAIIHAFSLPIASRISSQQFARSTFDKQTSLTVFTRCIFPE